MTGQADGPAARAPRPRWTWPAVAMAVVGAVLVSVGAAWVFPPAGVIVAGALLLVAGVGAFV